FVKIGAHAFVCGASLVRKNIPPFVKAAREPVSYVGINSIGLRRRGYDEATVKEIEDIYRTIFVKNQNTSKGVSQAKLDYSDSDTKKQIIDFIEASDKGVMRGA
ncbi:MAG: acyl-[acyl-carrier-protein]--UDP-N-acetylglucosamine O-acyltransferase, partial [Flavobacteriales bacterium]|nr:acyl-[acyl-carrier-protein]--UDP-N-acetylglucosamine O-acyltransferase [Flavobacteriales bacterium]